MTTYGTCLTCNERRIIVEAGQLTHPCCDPDDTCQPVLSLDEITDLIGDLGRCEDCGEPIRGPGFTNKCRTNHKVASA